MVKKAVIYILFFYLLALLQTSFFPHFFNFTPNLILIAIVLINLFENPKNNLGVFLAFFGGFLLDVFSGGLFGFWTLLLLAVAVFIKYLVRQHIQPSVRFG